MNHGICEAHPEHPLHCKCGMFWPCPAHLAAEAEASHDAAEMSTYTNTQDHPNGGL